MKIERPAILITDDDREFRETLGRVLAPRGYDTLFASNGEEALSMLVDHEVHLLLLDYHMARLTGVETMRLAQRMRIGLPCVLLSAELDDEIRQQAKQAHAFSVLSKPVTGQQITSTVKKALAAAYGCKVESRP